MKGKIRWGRDMLPALLGTSGSPVSPGGTHSKGNDYPIYRKGNNMGRERVTTGNGRSRK